MILTKIQEKAEQYFLEVQAIRHHIHAHPELSFHEHHTSSFIEEKLKALGIKCRSGVAGTGIVAMIEGKDPAKRCIALRADMDALPIQEKNEGPYVSQNNGGM